MKHLLVFLLAAASALGAEKTAPSMFWDASKIVEIAGGYKAVAGPAWKTNGDPLDTTKTPPDSYWISVEKKSAEGSLTLVEKHYPIEEVDWPRLKKSNVADIIKYQAATFRVGFFLKGPSATFVHTMPFASGAGTPAPDSASPPETPSLAPGAAPAIEAPGETAPAAGDLAKAKRFVPSVVYHVEKGVKEYKTKRWGKLPRLEVVSKDTELAAFATALNTAIFTAAGPLPQGDGKLTVYIGPAKEVVSTRKKLVPQSADGNWLFWSYWNSKREFTGALVFIVTDRLSPREARQALARCLMGAAGFPDESREYKESILHPDNQSVELASIDKRLIAFIYQHTEPGIGREALLVKMNQYWQ